MLTRRSLDMKSKKFKPSEADLYAAKMCRDLGFPYTAKYFEKYGLQNRSPWFFKGFSKESEAFYKKCVEEGHPWNYYQDDPEDAVL